MNCCLEKSEQLACCSSECCFRWLCVRGKCILCCSRCYNCCVGPCVQLPEEPMPAPQAMTMAEAKEGSLVAPYGSKEPPLYKLTGQELQDFTDQRLPNTIWTIVKAVPQAAWASVFRRGVRSLSNDDFVRYIDTTAFALLCEPEKRAHFASFADDNKKNLLSLGQFQSSKPAWIGTSSNDGDNYSNNYNNINNTKNINQVQSINCVNGTDYKIEDDDADEDSKCVADSVPTNWCIDCRDAAMLPVFPGLATMGSKVWLCRSDDNKNKAETVALANQEATTQWRLTAIQLYIDPSCTANQNPIHPTNTSKRGLVGNNSTNSSTNISSASSSINPNKNRLKALPSFKVTPKDPAWEAAKLISMHAINHKIVLQVHSMIHFPVSVIAQITQQELTEDNPVKWLLLPHLKYTAGVNDLVLNRSYSVLLDHTNPASPFDTSFETTHLYDLQPGFAQCKISKTMPLRYPSEFAFGRMMNEYVTVIEWWVQHLLQLVLFETAIETPPSAAAHLNQLQSWFKQISVALPAFWSEYSADNLTRALVYILTKVTVEHSAQHYLYAQIPTNVKPWRWRSELPQSAQHQIDLSRVAKRIDRFQEEVANQSIFGVSPAALLRDVQYRDQRGHTLGADYVGLRNQLQQVALRHPHGVPISAIAQSIDF
jgi:hypothetical protein